MLLLNESQSMSVNLSECDIWSDGQDLLSIPGGRWAADTDGMPVDLHVCDIAGHHHDLIRTPDRRWALGMWDARQSRYATNQEHGYRLREVTEAHVIYWCMAHGTDFPVRWMPVSGEHPKWVSNRVLVPGGPRPIDPRDCKQIAVLPPISEIARRYPSIDLEKLNAWASAAFTRETSWLLAPDGRFVYRRWDQTQNQFVLEPTLGRSIGYTVHWIVERSVDIFSYNYDGEVAPDARSAGFRSWALPGLTELDEQVNPIAPSSGAAPACDGDNEPDDTADPPNQIPGIAAASDDVGSRNAPRHSAFPAGPSKATPVVAPFDEAAIADALASKGFTLEAAFVRRFKGHTTVHWMDIVEGVCPGEDRDWATVKTWVHRVKSALLEIDSHCRLSFSTTTRDHLVIKKVLSK